MSRKGQHKNLSAQEYGRLHHWVRKHKGKPTYCENDPTHPSKRFEWACIRNEYRYNVDDFQSLCLSCHRKLDYSEKCRELVRARSLGNKWRRRGVVQQSANGDVLKTFESIAQASTATGINADSISNNAAGRSHSAGGFGWAYVDEAMPSGGTPPQSQYHKSRVERHDAKNGLLLATYRSLTEAARLTGVGATAISNNLTNRSKTAGGFVWRYMQCQINN